VSTADHDADAAPPADAGLFGLPTTPDEARLVIVPVPWDATTSYRAGTSRGPAAIRTASHQLDLFDADLGEPWRAGIAMLDIPDEVVRWNMSARVDAEKIIEVGGRIGEDKALAQALARVNDAGAKLNRHVYEQVDRYTKAGKLVGVLGGDHSVPFGAIARMAESHDGFGILHVDAHCDLRDAYEGFEWSHASIMYNVIKKIPQVQRLVQVGIRDFAKREADAVATATGRVSCITMRRLPSAASPAKRGARSATASPASCPARSMCRSTSTASIRSCAPVRARRSPVASRSSKRCT
jgi:agmatinase